MSSSFLNFSARKMLSEVRSGKRVFGGNQYRTARKLERLGLVKIVVEEKRPNRITGSQLWYIEVEPCEK